MDTPAVQTQSLLQRIKTALTNTNWKYVALGVGITFLIAPTPFLKLFKPFLRRIHKSYVQIQKNQIKKIMFTTSENLIDQILIKYKLKRSDIIILNYSQICKSQNIELCEIWSKIIETELNQTFSPYILVVANPQIIQNTEIRLYHMEEKQRFKIGLIKEKQFHCINYQSNSFRLMYETVEI